MPQTVRHPLAPLCDSRSRVLLLGTMPSPRSREQGFYYAHPQNRFWPIFGALFGETVPESREGRLAWLLGHRIALWDVLQSCEIEGADDGSIRSPVPNDISQILRAAPIQKIFTTGSAAARLYRKYCLPSTGVSAFPLPSTSPANCRFYTLETLIEAYRPVLDALRE